MGDRTQRVKGKANELAGKSRVAAGRSTGNTSERVKGSGQAIKGKTQQAAGKASSKVKKATR